MCRPTFIKKKVACIVCYRHVPLLRENVNLVDPFTYMSGPLNDVTRQLGDLLDLVEERSLCFLNSIYDLATSSTVPPNADLHVSVFMMHRHYDWDKLARGVVFKSILQHLLKYVAHHIFLCLVTYMCIIDTINLFIYNI